MSPCDKRLTNGRHRTLFFVMVSIAAYIFIIRRTRKKSTSNNGNDNIQKIKREGENTMNEEMRLLLMYMKPNEINLLTELAKELLRCRKEPPAQTELTAQTQQ